MLAADPYTVGFMVTSAACLVGLLAIFYFTRNQKGP